MTEGFKMADFFKSIFDAFSKRLTNPLMGSFTVFWSIWNWKFVYFLFFADERVSVKIDILSNIYNENDSWLFSLIGIPPVIENILVPLILAVLSLLLMPHILNSIQKLQISPNTSRIDNRVYMNFIEQKAVVREKIKLERLQLQLENMELERIKAEEETDLIIDRGVESNQSDSDDILKVSEENVPSRNKKENNNPSKKENSNELKPKLKSKKQNEGRKIPSHKSSTVKKSTPGKYTLNKDLDLHPNNGKSGLKEFMDQFNVNTNYERFLLITHYLKEIKGVEIVGPDEIYTCFKYLDIKIPIIEAGLRITSSRKGWLDTSDTYNITITRLGENAITHELLKKDTD